MKKALFIFSALSAILYFSSCRKCYTCTNECTQCTGYDTITTTIYDTVNNVVTSYDTTMVINVSNVICTDDATNRTREDYVKAIAYYEGLGFTCAAHLPTYNFDFCVDNSGQKAYPDYFNRGGRAPCVEKK